jgi:hypothetical protein
MNIYEFSVVKNNQVYSHTKQTAHPFDFRVTNYDYFGESCTDCKGLRRIEKKIPHMLLKCNFSHVEHFMHSNPTRRVVSRISIPCILYL